MTNSRIRHDGVGVLPGAGHQHNGHGEMVNVDSLSYDLEDSDAWRAYLSLDHYRHRGLFWNQGKHKIFMRYVLTAFLGIAQGCIAYFCNIVSMHFIEVCLRVNLISSLSCFDRPLMDDIVDTG